MKLLPAHLVPRIAHDEAAGEEHPHERAHAADGIEWEDDMVEVNRMTTPANTRAGR